MLALESVNAAPEVEPARTGFILSVRRPLVGRGDGEGRRAARGAREQRTRVVWDDGRKPTMSSDSKSDMIRVHTSYHIRSMTRKQVDP